MRIKTKEDVPIPSTKTVDAKEHKEQDGTQPFKAQTEEGRRRLFPSQLCVAQTVEAEEADHVSKVCSMPLWY